MKQRKVRFDGCYVCSLSHDAEAIAEIKEFVAKEKIDSAFFTIIGAVKEAVISFYDQKAKKYAEKKLPQPMEITSCIGNVRKKTAKQSFTRTPASDCLTGPQ